MSKIEIPLGDDIRLIAETNTADGYKEIVVGHKKGDVYWQDLAVIGEAYHYDDIHDGPVLDHGKYIVRVYSDEGIDDYTDKFTIEQYKEEEP